MIAYVNLGNSGDVFAFVVWPDEVETRYFPNGARFDQWFRWHKARAQSCQWMYISATELDALLKEHDLTMADFNKPISRRRHERHQESLGITGV